MDAVKLMILLVSTFLMVADRVVASVNCTLLMSVFQHNPYSSVEETPATTLPPAFAPTCVSSVTPILVTTSGGTAPPVTATVHV